MNPKAYWNNKITTWEFARYSLFGAVNPASWSVRSRMKTAMRFLEYRMVNQPQIRVLELGCGSGELAKKLKKHAGTRYWGFDIAEIAIQKAKTRIGDENFTFSVGDITTATEYPAADYAVLLGVTDWISPEALRFLLTKIPVKNVLISFTEKKLGARGGIYSLYRLLKDSKANQTETFTDFEFAELCRSAGWVQDQDLTNKMMLPGRLLWLKKSTLT